MTDSIKLSPIEDMKTASRFLRGTLAEELETAEPGFSPDSQQLIKLHGMYQQKDRDRAKSGGAEPTLLLRGRIPGGRLNAEQYLAWDRLAETFGDATLRITTRQSLELHGLAKGNLKAVTSAIHRVQLTSQGACGDVVRNVTQAVNPLGRPELAQLDPLADLLSRHFMARSNAYLEIWLDGEAVEIAKESEPILGATYLPRKFKISLTLAGENSIDLLSNDLGFAATLDEAGAIAGYFVFAGGGQGQSITDPTTFARLADHLGWVPKEALVPVAEAVITTFLDHGNRSDRKRARLKYLIHNQGLDWFKAEVERRSGFALEARKLPEWNTPSNLGWQERVDGTWALGLHVLSGRLLTEARKGLAQVIDAPQLDVQLTTDQDLILLGVKTEAKANVDEVLQSHGLQTDRPGTLRQKALACVALPLCSLAITEAERALPDFIDQIEASLNRHGLSHRAPVFRITGCGNGCARPYSAELALVGQGVDKYAIFAGGHPESTRLAVQVAERVPKAEIATRLDKLFARWATEGTSNESFGEFTHRLGAENVKAILEN
jgi:sulfite reductase beta subunit-like hemoprotein